MGQDVNQALQQQSSEHALSRSERIHLLGLEMQLLQSRFDKYDDLIFRSRGWLIVVVVATLGAGISGQNPNLAYLASAVAAFFYVVEGLWRLLYLSRFVHRYKYLRDKINSKNPLEGLKVYDLTNELGGPKPSKWKDFRTVFLRVEPLFFYSVLCIGPLIVRSQVG
jgi:hypothetical protein